MNILYAIQGTGNGHISRARVLGPAMERLCEVDYLVSGKQVDLDLHREVTYRTQGVSFYFGKQGGVDLSKTISRNSAGKIFREINELPVEKYDAVINDFEPISAWAARRKKVPCIALSHQSALISPYSPRPGKKDLFGQAVLNHYAPADRHYGFHFDRFDSSMFTPVIRTDLRRTKSTQEGHYLVYLPSYEDQKIFSILSQLPEARWEVFSKHCRHSFEEGNVRIRPVHDRKFGECLASCTGLLCGAGFESPSEALFLGKKLMVIPMKNQYEQHCNASALEQLGVPVIKKLSRKKIPHIRQWIESGPVIHRDYPDEVCQIVETIIHELQGNQQ